MKMVIVLLSFLIFNSSAYANQCIEVTKPGFTAEKIEFNPVTESYVVVNPRYYINAATPWKVAYKNDKALKHLCKFLGMSGGKYISGNYGYCPGNTILVHENGLYGDASHYGSCTTIDFLECTAQ